MATALAVWTEQARESQHAAHELAEVKQALTWLKADGQEIRNARLEPFAQLSAQIWDMLRQESNVELGPIRLEGSATRRRLSLDATVDGVACTALGVMSQGELHALGLALFLPRATSPDSPFRFLLIDDPVQSMDPAKVDGLARVLSRLPEPPSHRVYPRRPACRGRPAAPDSRHHLGSRPPGKLGRRAEEER